MFLKSKNLFPYFFNNIILYILYSHYLPNKYKKNLIKTLKLKKYKKLNNIEYIINSKEINSIFEYQKITIKKSNLFKYKNPYFSIIIYCNELKYLEETLLSIINQKFQKYEVIILYDNEINEYIKIKKFIESYKNIKLINNLYVRGLITSLSKGTLFTSGEYILILLSSYKFSKEIILNEIYSYMINNSNVNILEFNLLVSEDDPDDIFYNNSLNIYKCSYFETTINLRLMKYNKNYEEQNKKISYN